MTNGTQLLINGSNPVIDTSNTGTASLFNANATTVNIGGAATTVSIGASTGRTSINNDASADNFIVNGSAGQFIGNVQGAIGANVPNIGIFTNITATNAIHGNLSAGNINGYLNGALGANIPNTVVATSVTTTNGGQHVGYFTGAIGANTSNSGVFTTVSASTVNAGTIGNSGAVLTASTATITGTANSYAAGQGALQITGGFYAGGDSYIAGNLIVSNLQAVQQTILSIQDPLLYLQNQGIGTYNYDIGFYGHFIGGNNNNYQHTGLVRNYIDNDWYLFSNAPEPSGNVIAFGSNTVYDTLKLGALLVQNTTTSSSSTTGALQVAGGAGIAGSLYAGSIQNTPIGSITPSTGVFTTANINGTLYAATINAGAIGNTNTTFSGASLTVTGSVTAGSFIGNSNGNISGYLNGALGANVPNTVVATSVITSSGGQHIGYFTGAIGANTPNTGVFTTASTSGNLTVGGNLTVTGNLNAVTANVYTQGGIFYGAPGTGMNALYAGLSSYTPLSNVIAQFSANVNNFAQINSQNANAGAQASTDFIATANNGSDNDTYIDMGINSSGYNQAAFSITQANDGYLYVAGNTTTGGGNLVFSTTTLNDIVFSLAGTTAANEFARMRANTNSFVISSTTTSTSNTTGALQVRGGTGITGNIYSGANIYATTAMSSPSAYRNNLYPYSGSDINYNTGTNGNLNINPNGVVANLVVNGNTAASYGNLLVVNGSTGQVGVKTPIGSFVGNASFQINSTDSIIIPVGTTSQRPSNTTTGMMRFNTQVGQIEFWNGSQWSTTAGSFTVISENTYTGDGTTTAFTLSQSSTTNATLVMINGVVQIPITAYSVSGTTLTFTEAPLSTDIIAARVITTSTTVTALTAGTSAININDSGAGTGNASTIVNNSVRYIANSGTSGSNYFNGGQAPTMGNVSLTQSTPTVIDTFSVSAFRGAKYVVKVTDGTNNVYSMAEVIIVHDGTTPTSQIYGVVNTGSNSLANFSTTLSAGSVNLLANTWSSTASATVFQTYMPL